MFNVVETRKKAFDYGNGARVGRSRFIYRLGSSLRECRSRLKLCRPKSVPSQVRDGLEAGSASPAVVCFRLPYEECREEAAGTSASLTASGLLRRGPAGLEGSGPEGRGRAPQFFFSGLRRGPTQKGGKAEKGPRQPRKDARKRVEEAGQALKCSLAAGGAWQVRGAPKSGSRAQRSQAHEHARSAALRQGLGQGLSQRFVASWVRWKRRCLGTRDPEGRAQLRNEAVRRCAPRLAGLVVFDLADVHLARECAITVTVACAYEQKTLCAHARAAALKLLAGKVGS